MLWIQSFIQIGYRVQHAHIFHTMIGRIRLMLPSSLNHSGAWQEDAAEEAQDTNRPLAVQAGIRVRCKIRISTGPYTGIYMLAISSP